MSLKVHTIDRYCKKLPPINLNPENQPKKAEEDFTYNLKDQSLLFGSKLNTTRGHIDTSYLQVKEEAQIRLEREEAFDHFLEVPDNGVILRRKDATFTFWFLVPADFSKTPGRFMTFLQGHVEIGGYFVITKGKS